MIVALSVTFARYLGDYSFLGLMFHNLELLQLSQAYDAVMVTHVDAKLYRLIYWATVVSFFFFVVPCVFIVFVLKEKLIDYGLGFNGAFKDYKLAILMLAIMLPLIIYFSGTQSFLATYPFYKFDADESLYPNFFIWESFYFMQFVALEFFFRGFVLHGTKQRFGFYAIFVMMIPYCMIHFDKPIMETIAAIIAGIVLGIMSLRSKSIWMGVFVHCCVALTMDLCALYRKGMLL
ncbi:MAG: CPBP family intramembrane metalloprotease [Nitrosomonas sp.]|nr:CPBP family intramembrane metalloprotease [Nitrosomonas sp.]